MNGVRQELDRLGGAWARTRGRDAVAKGHLALIGLAALAALGHRVLGPWPVLSELQGHWILAPAAALLLLLLGPVLLRLVPALLRPAPRVVARRLDDTLDWRDAADTALDLRTDEAAPPVEAFHATQTRSRLEALEPARLWPARREGVWLGRLLALAFLLFLVLPGAGRFPGDRGAGHGQRAGLGVRPDEAPEEPVDADRWLAEHARLVLLAPDAMERPLLLRTDVLTDLPLPAPYRTDLVLDWDGTPLAIGPVDLEEGERAREEIELRLDEIEGLAGLLTEGTHVARTRLVPREGPWRADLVSNEVEVEIQPGGGGNGGGASDPPEPEPEPTPEPEPDPPPAPAPEGPEEQPPLPPPDESRVEVVEPFVREDGETVVKEDAIVAVPDPERGLEPPRQVSLGDALQEFERVLERAMGRERISPSDREFLLRYFEALRRSVGGSGSR